MIAPRRIIGIAYHWIALLRNPLATEHVFAMANIGIKTVAKTPELKKQFIESVDKIEGLRSLYESRYLPNLDMDQLGKCPEGSLGRTIHAHYTTHNLQPDFYISVDKIDGEITYTSELMRRTHDIWHSVLGRGIEIEDELYIQAFMVGQMEDPLAGAIISGGILHMVIKDPTRLKGLVGAVADGFITGKNAKHFVGVNWDSLFDQPIDQVRRDLGITD
jgi:ubiquinone biosynthesis protein Coq4